MTCLIKCVFQIKLGNVNIDFMEENVIQINCGITINIDVSVKQVMHLKKIMFIILLHVTVKMEKI